MNEPNELIPAYLQATKVIVGFCMYAIPTSHLQNERASQGLHLEKSLKKKNK